MEPDPLQQAWQASGTHPQLRIDMEQVLSDVRRDQQAFDSMILFRDIREVGVSLVMIVVWIVLGAKLALPWTWYLVIPGLIWIAGFLLVDRARQKRRRPEPGESLRRHVEDSLAQVEHQIWLLRNVFWWYLLPLALPMFAFFGQVAWRVPGGKWEAVIFFVAMIAFCSAIDAFVYWLNRFAIRTSLEPRRQELETLLRSLEEEARDTASQ